jgi:hypothetical protein
MKIIIGTQREQIELSDVKWIICDTCELRLHTDGGQAVIEEVKDEDKDL